VVKVINQNAQFHTIIIADVPEKAQFANFELLKVGVVSNRYFAEALAAI
jgi:hypothetical protein